MNFFLRARYDRWSHPTAGIRQLLEERAPCLDEYDLERCVKKLVHRSCGSDHAPDALRQKILLRLTRIQIETSITTD